jgi:GH18 family chitinase
MSTDPSTYSIFRNGVSNANRQIFANNLAAFVNQWGLDGIDIDWEYPDEQDIAGIPAASEYDGWNLTLFLQALRALLPISPSLSQLRHHTGTSR